MLEIRRTSTIRQARAGQMQDELASLANDRARGTLTLGFTCHSFPAALAAGLGMRPVRVLCGASADAETMGEQVVRPDICPLVKTVIGNVRERKGLHSRIDLWAGLATCDQMRRGMETLSRDLGRTVYPIHVPATRTAESAAYYVDQVRRFVRDNEARLGRRFDAARARDWQGERDRAAAVLSRAARSGIVSPVDLHMMFHLFLVARPEGLADYFVRLLAASPPYRPKATLLLAGSPLALEDTVLLEELEQRGYAVVPLNCTGLNSLEDGQTASGGEDLIEALALRAFHLPHCARNRPNTPVYDRIRKNLESTRAAGIIVKSLTFCDHWYTERERMRKSFDVPVLVFGSDYADGGRERLMTRIDTFLETIG